MIELLSDLEGEGGFLYEEGSGPRSESFASLEARGTRKKYSTSRPNMPYHFEWNKIVSKE